MEISGGESFDTKSQYPQLVSQVNSAAGRGTFVGVAAAQRPHVDEDCHPRLLAVVAAARFHGIELDPGAFPKAPNGYVPSAAICAPIRHLSPYGQFV